MVKKNIGISVYNWKMKQITDNDNQVVALFRTQCVGCGTMLKDVYGNLNSDVKCVKCKMESNNG